MCSRHEHCPTESSYARAKFGVSPESIPDYLALVGDAADGYPGLAGWGTKSSAAVLAKLVHLESIPKDCREWRVNAANASALADTLCRDWDNAILFRKLAILNSSMMWTSCVGMGHTRVRINGGSIRRVLKLDGK